MDNNPGSKLPPSFTVVIVLDTHALKVIDILYLKIIKALLYNLLGVYANIMLIKHVQEM